MAGAIKVQISVDDVAHSVAAGAFAQIAAKRVYGIDAIRSGDPEPVLYAVWVELDGIPNKATASQDFDRWLQRVTSFEIAKDEEVADSEDPPPAESSGSSPFSPPTSA